MQWITYLSFNNGFKLFKTTVNTTKIKINFSICCTFYFNTVIFCKFWTFITMKIIFILLVFFWFFFISSISLNISSILIIWIKSLRDFYCFFHLIIFFQILFTETNSPWLIHESFKSFEIKTPMVFRAIIQSYPLGSYWFLAIDIYCTCPLLYFK